jgi:hypothetical protein
MLIVHHANSIYCWQSVTYMMRLAIELFDAESMIFGPEDKPTLRNKLEAALWKRPGDETCLVICSSPADLGCLFLVPEWRTRFRRIVGWVIDSFWIDHIPRSLRYSGAFDHIFITTEEDLPAWKRLVKSPMSCLPLGSDVLRFGSGQVDRPVDLLRMGRQPDEWKSDEETGRDCREIGLEFQGGTPYIDDATEGQRVLMEVYGRSKLLLASSNMASATHYTHPTRDYLTTRWFDAVASGTSVVGITPKAKVVDQLFWPGALLELGTTNRAEGLKRIAELVKSWRPEQATENHRQALLRLDWRWRFAAIARELGESPEALDAEIRLLKQAAGCADLTPQGCSSVDH